MIRNIGLCVLLGLSGCSPYSNKFDCPYGQGMGCASLSTVNNMVDANNLALSSDVRSLSTAHHQDDPQSQSAIVYRGENQPTQMIRFQKDI